MDMAASSKCVRFPIRGELPLYKTNTAAFILHLMARQKTTSSPMGMGR